MISGVGDTLGDALVDALIGVAALAAVTMNAVVVGLVVAALCGAAALAYNFLARESITASAFRKPSKYKVAHLSAGATAYRDLGKKGDTVLVIVHGGTLGSLAYVPYEAPFLEQHFRVITYDQYGRGFSDRPEAPLTLEVLRQQLEELLDHLNIHTAVPVSYTHLTLPTILLV